MVVPCTHLLFRYSLEEVERLASFDSVRFGDIQYRVYEHYGVSVNKFLSDEKDDLAINVPGRLFL